MYLGRDTMYTIRATIDYQSDFLLATPDRDHAVTVGDILAKSKIYAQIEVEDPFHNVIWATYPPAVASKESWYPPREAWFGVHRSAAEDQVVGSPDHDQKV